MECGNLYGVADFFLFVGNLAEDSQPKAVSVPTSCHELQEPSEVRWNNWEVKIPNGIKEWPQRHGEPRGTLSFCYKLCELCELIQFKPLFFFSQEFHFWHWNFVCVLHVAKRGFNDGEEEGVDGKTWFGKKEMAGFCKFI